MLQCNCKKQIREMLKILIQGIQVDAITPRMAFVNNTSYSDNNYQFLERAIFRSKLLKDAHNYLIGEKLQLKSDFNNFGSNILIIAEKNNEFKYIVIIKNKILEVTNDIDDVSVKNIFLVNNFEVIDAYGRKLLIHKHSDLISFIEVVKKSREQFKYNIESYHKFMDMLFEFRRERSSSLNCNVSQSYSKLISITDEFVKEVIDVFNDFRENEEHKIEKQFFYAPSLDEKNCAIFGLYLAMLKNYKFRHSDDKEYQEYDAHVKQMFFKEMNCFLCKNSNIVEKYAEHFNLKNNEKEETNQLLKECCNDGFVLNSEPSELKIL